MKKFLEDCSLKHFEELFLKFSTYFCKTRENTNFTACDILDT